MRGWSVVVLGLVGCSVPEPPPARPAAPAPASQAAPRADAAAGPASAAARQARLDPTPLRALQRQLRYKHFRRQIPVTPTPALGPELPALLPSAPAGAFKVVAYEVKRRMALSRPAPGRRQEMLRAVTRLEGLELRAALKARLVAARWMAAGEPLADRYQDPARGVLSLSVTSRPEEAAVVEWVLDRKPAAAPLTGGAALLEQAPPWLAPAGWPAPVVGLELSRFHARGGGIRTTDVERLAVALEGDPAALQAGLEARIAEAGFTAREDNPHSFKGPGGLTFASVAVGEHLVAVHQRRWRRAPPKGAPGPTGEAPKPAQR